MNKPKYVAIVATTLDGKIARHEKHFSDWTSLEDKALLHALLNKSDCIIVGRNTYETAVTKLRKRNCIMFTTQVKTVLRKSEKLLLCNPGTVDIRRIIRQQHYKTVAILGGTQVYSYCLEHGLLNELFLTIEPLAFGNGLPLFNISTQRLYGFQLLAVKKLNAAGSVLLHYKKG